MDYIPGRTNTDSSSGSCGCQDVGCWRINDGENCRFAIKYDTNAGSGQIIVPPIGINSLLPPLPSSPGLFRTPVGCGFTHCYWKCVQLCNEIPIGDGGGGGGGIGGVGDPRVIMFTHGTRTDRFPEDPIHPNEFTGPPGFYAKFILDPFTQVAKLFWYNGTVETFRPLNGLIAPGFVCRIQGRNNNAVTLGYNQQGLLQSVFDPFTSSTVLNSSDPCAVPDSTPCLTFFYNISTRLLERVVDRGGREVVLGHDFQGRLVSLRSPVVTNTPNGNDFPFGKETRFQYLSSPDPTLGCLLTRVIKPNEVAAGLDVAAITLQYNLDTLGGDFTRVTHATIGGTNAQGFTAGGTIDYSYQHLGGPIDGPVTAALVDPINAPVFCTTATDRNRNVTEYCTNALGNIVSTKEFTRGVRTGDPAFFLTQREYNSDGQKTREILPLTNEHRWVFDVTNPDRFAQGNMLEHTRLPDTARGGDQAFLTRKFRYEPVFQRVAALVEERGNDPSYVPQNGGAQSAERYTTRYVYDYQEANNISGLASKTGRSATFLQAQLTAAASDVPMNLGDVNGDGRTDQIMGNMIQMRKPLVVLPDMTTQLITEESAFNDVGQRIVNVDGEGNKNTFDYHPENDPNGDGLNILPGVSSQPRGYLFRITQDTEVTAKRTETAPPLRIKNDFFQDEAGNTIRMIDGRRNDILYSVNSLNQVVEKQERAPFRYRFQTFFDANNNAIQRAIENRTVLLDAQARPVTDLFLGTPSFFRHFTSYDILDNVRKTDEDATGSTPARLITTTERDANQNSTRIMRPEGNKFEASYDERDLASQSTRGAGSVDASTWTQNYDLNRNPVEFLRAMDNSGIGTHDRTRTVFDGFDRARQTIDALGNSSIRKFDPASNTVQVSGLGHPPGVSPVDDSGSSNILLSRSFKKYDEISRRFQSSDALFVDVANAARLSRPANLTDAQNDGLIDNVWFFDRNTRTVKQVEDDGDTSFMEFDGVNREIHRLDGENNETLTTYDDNHNPTQITMIEKNPEARFPNETFLSRITFDSLDRESESEDPLRHVRRTLYDSRNNPVFRSDANDGVSAEGTPNSVHGNTISTFYDGMNRRLQVDQHLRIGGKGNGNIDHSNSSNSDGNVTTRTTWDGNSRRKTLIDDNGNTTINFYNQRDVLVKEQFADGTTNEWTLDLDDNPIRLKDENGNIFVNLFDRLNRRIKCDVTRAPGIVGTTIQTTQFDGLSRRTRMTDNNDPLDPSDDTVCEFSHDSLSRILEERQDPGDGVLRAIDSGWFSGERRNLLIYPSGRKIAKTFDHLDRESTILDEAESSPLASYSYIGPRRTKEHKYQNGIVLSISYDGDRRPLDWLNSRGTKLLLGYAQGWDREDNRQFEQFLHRKKDHKPAPADVFGYDSLYRVIDGQFGVNNPANPQNPKFRSDYTLDGVGNWARFQRNRGNHVLFDDSNAVNEMNEYTQFDNIRESHDDNGNLVELKKFKKPGLTGRVDSTKRFKWDAFNRLALGEEAGESGRFKAQGRYAYHADNRRAFKVESTKGLEGHEPCGGLGKTRITKFFYDGWRTIEEQSVGQLVEATFVQGPMHLDEHITMDRRLKPRSAKSMDHHHDKDDNDEDDDDDKECEDRDDDHSGEHRKAFKFERFFYHQNVIFNVMGLSNSKGKLVERVSYDVYGEPFLAKEVNFKEKDGDKGAPKKSKIGNPYLFTGQRLDPETGLMYYKNRYFSFDMGRFLSRDPIGYHGGMNLGRFISRGRVFSLNMYLYASGNPPNNTDSMGLQDDKKDPCDALTDCLKKAAEIEAGSWTDMAGATRECLVAYYDKCKGKDGKKADDIREKILGKTTKKILEYIDEKVTEGSLIKKQSWTYEPETWEKAFLKPCVSGFCLATEKKCTGMCVDKYKDEATNLASCLMGCNLGMLLCVEREILKFESTWLEYPK